MTAPIIRLFADAAEVSRAAADEFVRRAGESIAARGRFTVALSGGSTPQRLYQLLAEPALRAQVDWNRVDLFWGDERCVPPDQQRFQLSHGPRGDAVASAYSAGAYSSHGSRAFRP